MRQFLGTALPRGEWHQGRGWGVWEGVTGHWGSLATGSVIHAEVHRWGPQVIKEGSEVTAMKDEGEQELGQRLRTSEQDGGYRSQGPRGWRTRAKETEGDTDTETEMEDALCSEAEPLAGGARERSDTGVGAPSRGHRRLGAEHPGADARVCWGGWQGPTGPTEGNTFPPRKAEVRAGGLGGGQPGGPDLGLHVGSHALGGPDDHVGHPVSQAGRAPGVPLPHPAGRGWVRAGGRRVGGTRKWWAWRAGVAISGQPGPQRTSRPAPRGPACRRSQRPRGSAPW